MSSEALRHVAIIMDGNNRWAKREGKQGIMGHRAGVERIRDVLEACRKNDVEVLTVFAFSSENWRRPPKEVEALMGLFYSYLKREARRLAEEKVRLKVIGSRSRFSESLRRAIEEAENTAGEGDATLVIAADYGGQWDMAQAARKVVEEVIVGNLSLEDVSPETIDRHISTHELPPLDLLIRTGGELRISNFLLWQAAYAELYFSPLLWPEFDGAAMEEAIADFYQRQRRFGRTGDQVTGQGTLRA
ncbi:MAG: polyprenyl diphosphate synthase [Cellvibrionaceae bacterium]|nr:polyprenyl diphosphate synthase [Cellvibrionaceae bacterium]